MRRCTRCLLDLDDSLFPKIGNQCKKCKAEILRNWRNTPPEKRVRREKQGDQCIVEDCDRKPKTKQLCNMHYKRLKARGTTDKIESLPEGETKVCSRCKIEKECKTEFYKNSKRPGYYIGHCKSCHMKHQIDASLKRKYGITEEEYLLLLEKQNGVCAICNKTSIYRGRKRNLAVDHCHETGIVRGLLCMTCNRALGLLGDKPENLKKALEYLEGFYEILS